MPVSALPELDHVFAKWDQRRAGGQPKGSGREYRGGKYGDGNREQADKLIEAGKQKWQDKFGQNLKPIARRGTRERKRIITVPAETIQAKTIAQFKSQPTILPEHFMTNRPFMGQCCNCMPNSQKDLVTPSTSSEGMRNILDVRHELRGSGPLSRQFANLVYSWRTKTYHTYPELSMDVLTSPRVRDVIQEELLAEEVKGEQAELEKRAKQILTVMKAKISNILTKFTGWFLQHFLGLMLDGVQVHRGQMKMIRATCQRGLPVLFLPLHKSHLDYILVTYILWNYEIKNPHIAAGDNLNIPFFSWLMKGLGGFFIRRKLDSDGAKKDSLYRAVLQSYMEQLLSNGETLEFFLEGGRSRTGKALPHKGGLLSVVVDSLNRGIMEDIYVAPVSISYEKILDGHFQNEQMGVAKKKESFFGAIVGIWRALRRHYGTVRVDFAQPFSLKEYLQSNQFTSISPDSSSSDISSPPSPRSMFRMGSNASLYGTDVVVESQRQMVNGLGEHVVHTCVQTTAVMSTSLLAFLLLTKHRQGTTLGELMEDYRWLREEVIIRKRDVGFFPASNLQDVVEYACTLLGPQLVTKTPGESHQDEHITPALGIPEVFELSYYGNQVISVFVLESILVNAVIYLSDINLSTLESVNTGEVILMSREEILEVAEQLCALLKYEFIFVSPCCSLQERLADMLDHLVTSELLRVEETEEFDACHNTFDRQWATRLSASLSWAADGGDDGEEDGEYPVEEQLLRVNLGLEGCREKLTFFHRILAPFFEAYRVTGHHIVKMLEEEIPEDDFVKTLHADMKDRVQQGVAGYGESAALETLKNAVRAYKHVKILDSYKTSNINMLELHGRFDVKERLTQYLQMLAALKE